jgi:hypothetical protein
MYNIYSEYHTPNSHITYWCNFQNAEVFPGIRDYAAITGKQGSIIPEHPPTIYEKSPAHETGAATGIAGHNPGNWIAYNRPARPDI